MRPPPCTRTTASAVALPALREQLALEIRKAKPNQLVLLDVGFFLHTEGAPEDRDLAREALFTLDPAADIVRANDRELFDFTRRVAASRDPRTLDFVDRAFLRGDVTVFVPEHALTLDETLVCVYATRTVRCLPTPKPLMLHRLRGGASKSSSRISAPA